MNIAATMIQRNWRNCKEPNSFLKLLEVLTKNRVKLQTAFRSMLTKKPMHDLIIEARMRSTFAYFNNVREDLEKDAVRRIWRCWRNYKNAKEQARGRSRRTRGSSRNSNVKGGRFGGNLTRKDSNVSVASIASRNNTRNMTSKFKKSPVSGSKNQLNK